MESWSEMLTHAIYKEREELLLLEEKKEADIPTIISKELLIGPKVVLLPGSTPNSLSVSADSIEGRSMLHQYFKLFHENYVEYAQKVYFELQHHAPHSKKIIASQYSRLREAQKKLLEVERKQEKIENRLERAVQLHSSLEERLQNLRTLPGLHKKPLSKAEREFKLELDKFTGVGLDALHSSIDALNARLKRHIHSPQPKSSNRSRQKRVNRVQDDELSHLKSSLVKLSLINSENTKKVNLVESALRSMEIND